MFQKTTKKRILFFLLTDIFLISLSFYLAFILRFDGNIPIGYNKSIITIIILGLIACLPVFYYNRLYSFSWSYVSTGELVSLAWSITLSFLLLGVAIFILRDQPIFQGFPRSVFIISYFLIFIFTGAVRFAKRVYLQSFKKEFQGKIRTLIVGAGDAGEQILRNIINSKDNPYLPIGFVDDSPAKKGVSIHGLEVLGKIDHIPNIVDEQKIEEMIIALPPTNAFAIKKATELGRKANLKKIKIVPQITEIIKGDVSFRNLREIQVGDLLGRDPVQIDTKLIEDFIKGKKILITGSAGSIGSELSRQVAKFKPSQLLLLDQDETGIFNISEELKDKFDNLDIKSLIVDIRDKDKIEKIFEGLKPNIVFHVAAYKHVPLMEKHSDEAIKNNVLGTKIIAENSLKNQVEKFIFISTDKAVNPTSIMGATKRVGEMICQTLNQKNSTKFISVRFGNVLDSRGSVIPIFREQIKKGGPVQITHPEMKRYFMIIPEACLLVMQSAEMGQGGEVFVLNMGKPVKILDLANEMIKLSGYEPDKDIPIVFIGTRPGEKLFEEILTSEEGTISTENQNIFKAKLSLVNEEKLNYNITRLEKAVDEFDLREIRSILKEIIPFYNPETLT
ncbi:MAG: nucleoside-diphosphate sugar epimerase/dehydratase [Candidatus Nealsonbacteria bacterium]